MWLQEQSVRRNKTPLATSSARTSDQVTDPAPLTARQLWVLARSATRELAWGLPAVSREVHRWQAKARSIPDQPLREDALSALRRKRGQTDGAALFSILPAARSLPLLRLLVAYQIMWDFLDSVHERAAEPKNGVQLHTALVDALDPTRAPRDYYMHHPWKHDGGYLSELVRVCRENCQRLPGFQAVAPLIATEATRAEVLALNHEPDPLARDALLQAWARREFAGVTEVTWWELSGAASAGLTIFALLALAADGNTTTQLLTRTRAVYSPWTTAAATMLDSYVDRVEDELNGDHSYVAHYPTQETAVERIGQLVQRAIRASQQLPNAERHTLITACMVAMYLTKDAARAPSTRHLTVRIARSGGSLTLGLMPVLRLWRIAYAQRAT